LNPSFYFLSQIGKDDYRLQARKRPTLTLPGKEIDSKFIQGIGAMDDEDELSEPHALEEDDYDATTEETSTQEQTTPSGENYRLRERLPDNIGEFNKGMLETLIHRYERMNRADLIFDVLQNAISNHGEDFALDVMALAGGMDEVFRRVINNPHGTFEEVNESANVFANRLNDDLGIRQDLKKGIRPPDDYHEFYSVEDFDTNVLIDLIRRGLFEPFRTIMLTGKHPPLPLLKKYGSSRLDGRFLDENFTDNREYAAEVARGTTGESLDFEIKANFGVDRCLEYLEFFRRQVIAGYRKLVSKGDVNGEWGGYETIFFNDRRMEDILRNGYHEIFSDYGNYRALPRATALMIFNILSHPSSPDFPIWPLAGQLFETEMQGIDALVREVHDAPSQMSAIRRVGGVATYPVSEVQEVFAEGGMPIFFYYRSSVFREEIKEKAKDFVNEFMEFMSMMHRNEEVTNDIFSRLEEVLHTRARHDSTGVYGHFIEQINAEVDRLNLQNVMPQIQAQLLPGEDRPRRIRVHGPREE
jgi:hypothetical protein